ncbi:hypothetical protein [Halorubrum trueperi]|uniref:RNA ligase domain-containing protein n=1 Tax=Halorubrum trueperi TaxID=2004704 RepID=A0ABD5UJV6_9EURY
MRAFSPLPTVTDGAAPDDLLRGHLWILELIDGTGLRFRMDETGLLRFGDPKATYADDGEVPLELRPAVRHVREEFDREALRAAVNDPEGITFFGVATHRRGTDYDWARLPPFLGTDVYAEDVDTEDVDTADVSAEDAKGREGAFRPPDAAAAIFEGVGLAPVDAVEREVNARDFDPDAYAIPDSAWRDGPAAGVVVRNKRGGRGKITGEIGTEPANDGEPANGGKPANDDESIAAADDPDALVESHATRERFDRVVAAIERHGDPVTVDSLTDRIVESLARETPVSLGDGTRASVDPEGIRSAVVPRAQSFIDDRTDEW